MQLHNSKIQTHECCVSFSLASYKQCESLLNLGDFFTKRFYPIYYNVISYWFELNVGKTKKSEFLAQFSQADGSLTPLNPRNRIRKQSGSVFVLCWFSIPARLGIARLQFPPSYWACCWCDRIDCCKVPCILLIRYFASLGLRWSSSRYMLICPGSNNGSICPFGKKGWYKTHMQKCNLCSWTKVLPMWVARHRRLPLTGAPFAECPRQ